MSKIQYVPDKESPFIKKLYGKEDNFKVETLTYFGVLYELEKLQNQIGVLEKALELAVEFYVNLENGEFAKSCRQANVEYFKTKAKEMMKSE